MKRLLIAALTLGLLLVPAIGASGVTGKDKSNAARECHALKKAMGTENFREAFGTNKNKHNAFGKCVSTKSREEAKERRAAKRKAKRQCEEASESKAGGNGHGKGHAKSHGRAFRECVSEKTKENKKKADKKDKEKVNAAKACKAEQDDPAFASGHGGKSFDEFYGTNANDQNSFGKCVSTKAHAKND
jgi:hypothetical protein